MFGSWRKFAALTLVFLFCPTAALLFVAATTLPPKLEHQTFRDLALLSELFAKQISEEFDGLGLYVESFATRPTTVQAADAQDLVQLNAQITALVENNQKFSRAVYVNTNGVLQLAHPPDPSVQGLNFSDREWFKGAATANGSYVSDAYNRLAFDQDRVITVACAVRNRQGTTIGYLAGQYLLDDLNAWVDRVFAELPLLVVLVDKETNSIHGNAALIPRIQSVAGERTLNGVAHPLSPITVDGLPYLGQYDFDPGPSVDSGAVGSQIVCASLDQRNQKTSLCFVRPVCDRFFVDEFCLDQDAVSLCPGTGTEQPAFGVFLLHHRP